MNQPVVVPRDRVSFPTGVGLKSGHVRAILADLPRIGFFEIHAENYMGAGGPPHRYLAAIRDSYPLSIHGVGLSLGGVQHLDQAHLRPPRHVGTEVRADPGLRGIWPGPPMGRGS